jgi:pilus assembly protein CpaF
MEGDTVVMQDIFVYEQTGFVDGHILGHLRPTGIRPKFSRKMSAMGVELPAALFGLFN